MVCHLDLTDSTSVRSRPYQRSPPACRYGGKLCTICEVRFPSTRGHLPRLQSVRRKFPTSERTSDPPPGLPPSQNRQSAPSISGHAELLYRRFLSHAAATQAPLHDVLSGLRVKGSHPITWTPELLEAFEVTRAFGCSVMLDDVMASAHGNYLPWLSALELIPSLVVDCITWDPLFLPLHPL
jgi:hypothetical protein